MHGAEIERLSQLLAKLPGLGTDAVKGGQHTAQDVEPSAIVDDALQSPQVGDIFDDTDHRFVALGVGAKMTRLSGIEVTAIGAFMDVVRRLQQRVGKRPEQGLFLLQKL